MGSWALAGFARRAPAAAARFLLAPWESSLVAGPLPKHSASIINLVDGAAQLELPFAAHSALRVPGAPERALLIGKNEPRAVEIDFVARRIVRSFDSSSGRAFYGHGAYSRDGRHLYCTELDLKSAVGALVIRDAATLRTVGELATFGQSPHDCRVIDGGRTMLVVNAGRAPDYVGSCLTRVDLSTGKLLNTLANPTPRVHLTHFAVAADGTLVVSSAPNTGRPAAAGSIFVATPGRELTEVALPAALAVRLHDETLSVAIADAQRVAAVTVPAGNCVVFVDLPSATARGFVALDRPAGVVRSPDGRHFIVGARTSVHFVRVDTLTEDATLGRTLGFGSFSHMELA